MKKKMITRVGEFAGFDVIGATIHYEPIWRAFLRRLMAQLHADGLAWAEVRFAWPLNYCREGEEVPESDYSHSKRLSEFASQPLLSGVSEGRGGGGGGGGGGGSARGARGGRI